MAPIQKPNKAFNPEAKLTASTLPGGITNGTDTIVTNGGTGFSTPHSTARINISGSPGGIVGS